MSSNNAGGGEGSGGGGGRDGQQREVRDMQSLLRLCVQASGDTGQASSGNTTGGGGQLQLGADEERKAWLDQALKSMSVDVVKIMMEHIQFIKDQLQTLNKDTR